MTFPQRHRGVTQRNERESRPGPESAGLSVPAVTLVAIGLLASLAIALIAVWLLEKPLAGGHGARPEPGEPFPYARDWVHPGTELQEVQARARQLLTTTEWIDRDAGIARIDIETAMRLMAEVPVVPPPPPGDGAEGTDGETPAPTGADGAGSGSSFILLPSSFPEGSL